MRTILLALLLTACSCWGQAFTLRDPAFVGQKTAVAAISCTTTQINYDAAQADNQILGSQSQYTYIAVGFTAGSSFTVCSIGLKAYYFGSGTPTLASAIYTDEGTNAPGSIIGSWSGNKTEGSWTNAAPGTIELFTGLSASVTSGNHYFVVIKANTIDVSNAIRVNIPTGSHGPIYTSSDAVTWTVKYANSAYDVVVISQ